MPTPLRRRPCPWPWATSIDALAVGVTFAFLRVAIVPAVLFIGCTTLALSAAGVKAGSVFGARYRARAELFGGLVLILMGVKFCWNTSGYSDNPIASPPA